MCCSKSHGMECDYGDSKKLVALSRLGEEKNPRRSRYRHPFPGRFYHGRRSFQQRLDDARITNKKKEKGGVFAESASRAEGDPPHQCVRMSRRPSAASFMTFRSFCLLRHCALVCSPNTSTAQSSKVAFSDRPLRGKNLDRICWHCNVWKYSQTDAEFSRIVSHVCLVPLLQNSVNLHA